MSEVAKTPGTNEQDITALNAKISELETALAAETEAHLSTKQVNEGLQQQIELLEQAAKKPGKIVAKVTTVPDQTFKVDKTEYVFTAPAFSFGGKRITAIEALHDKKLLAALVEVKAGCIKRAAE